MLIPYVAEDHKVVGPEIIAELVKGVKLVVQVCVAILTPFKIGVTFTAEGKIFPFAEVKLIVFVVVVILSGAGLPLYSHPLFVPRDQEYEIGQDNVLGYLQ